MRKFVGILSLIFVFSFTGLKAQIGANQIKLDGVTIIGNANNQLTVVGIAPSGVAGGDLSGTYPNPTVARLLGQLPSYYLDRANHTGTQLANTISDLTLRINTDAPNVTLAGFNYLTLLGQQITANPISLTTHITGNLPVNNLNSGIGASGTTYWTGNGTWSTPIGGGGTVTNFSFVNSSGIFGTVTNPTTIPELTLALGDLISTSLTTINDITAGGNITGANLSGTNTGDQTITLTGDVTGSGTETFATTLANTAVTPGSYTNTDLTVDSKGRITAAANGSSGIGVVGIPTTTINAIPRWNDITATTIKNSDIMVSDVIVNNITMESESGSGNSITILADDNLVFRTGSLGGINNIDFRPGVAGSPTSSLIRFFPPGFPLATAVYDGTRFGIGMTFLTPLPESSSILELRSTQGGFLAPRMTTLERDLIATPAIGLFIYNIDDDEFNYFDGTIWTNFGGGAGITSLNGEIGASQIFETGFLGSSFNISSSTDIHTFNQPIVSAIDTGTVTPALFATWNSKESTLVFTPPLLRIGNVVSITQSGILTDGYLSSIDWNTFNNKLSFVTTDASQVGNGTVATPLGINVIHDATLVGNGNSIPLSVTNPNPATVVTVKAATTGNVGATTYFNGAGGIGRRLSSNALTPLPNQDGIPMAVGDRLLVKNQPSPHENGIYEVIVAVSNWIIQGTTDSDEPSELNGQIVEVVQGITQAGITYEQTQVVVAIGAGNDITYSPISGGGDVSSNTGTSVNGEVALFADATGKLIGRATGTGYAKLSNGVLSAQAVPIPVADISTGTPDGTKFLRDDGVLATPTATVADNSITNAKLADMATATIKGRVTAGTGDPEDLTMAQIDILLGQYAAITTSNYTNGSGALTNITGLTFPIAANENFIFEFSGSGSSLTASGIRFGTSIPAGATIDLQFWANTNSTVNMVAIDATASGTINQTCFSAILTVLSWTVRGSIRNGGTGGTFNLQARDMGVVNVCTIYAGAKMFAKKVN